MIEERAWIGILFFQADGHQTVSGGVKEADSGKRESKIEKAEEIEG
jgi:hypothetical protein